MKTTQISLVQALLSLLLTAYVCQAVAPMRNSDDDGHDHEPSLFDDSRLTMASVPAGSMPSLPFHAPVSDVQALAASILGLPSADHLLLARDNQEETQRHVR